MMLRVDEDNVPRLVQAWSYDEEEGALRVFLLDMSEPVTLHLGDSSSDTETLDAQLARWAYRNWRELRKELNRRS